MKIKLFDFPSFETWNETRKYLQKIGDYTCAVETFSYGCNGNSKNTYMAVIANSDNPTNIYVNKIISQSITCEKLDTATLKKWYESSISKLNTEWKNFILENYIYKSN